MFKMLFTSTVLSLALFQTGPARAAESVDVLLLLAVDASRSIDNNEYDVEHRGYVEALRDPKVWDAIQACAPGGLGLGYAEWGARRFFGDRYPFMVHSFVRIDARLDLLAFADRVEARGRTLDHDNTDIAGAIDDAVAAIKNAPFTGTRNVIDISSDGVQGPGGPKKELPLDHLIRARDEAVESGVTINALVLDRWDLPQSSGDGDFGSLTDYFEKFVTGGPGTFVMRIRKVGEVRDSLVRKLRREICDVST